MSRSVTLANIGSHQRDNGKIMCKRSRSVDHPRQVRQISRVKVIGRRFDEVFAGIPGDKSVVY